MQVDTCPGCEGVRTRDSARNAPEGARTEVSPCANQPHQSDWVFCPNEAPAGVGAAGGSAARSASAGIKTTLRHYSDVSQLPLAAAVANLPAFSVPTLSVLGSQSCTQTGVA